MDKNRKHYIKPETKGKAIFIICILLAITIGLIWNAMEAASEPPAWQTSYPMANAKISWEQTFHPGAWTE